MVSGGWANVFRENVSFRALLVLYISPLDFNLCSIPTLLCVLECISSCLKYNLPFCCCCCFPWEGWSKYTMLSEWECPVHSCKSHSEPHKRMFFMVPPGPVPNPCNPESPVGFFSLSDWKRSLPGMFWLLGGHTAPSPTFQSVCTVLSLELWEVVTLALLSLISSGPYSFHKKHSFRGKEPVRCFTIGTVNWISPYIPINIVGAFCRMLPLTLPRPIHHPPNTHTPLQSKSVIGALGSGEGVAKTMNSLSSVTPKKEIVGSRR